MPSDVDMACAKASLRILKAFGAETEVMKKLDSYIWKNLLFWEIEERPGHSWNKEDTARRVLGLLARLRGALSHGKMPQFFKRKVNLLIPVSKSARKDMHRFIDRLLSNKRAFIRVFTP